MELVAPFLPFFFKGVFVTLTLFFLGLLLALVVAFTAGIGKLSARSYIRWPCNVFIEVFRGTSALVQLFWVFYALPLLLDVDFTPMVAGVLVLGLNQGAYAAEVVRGAIQAVPATQWEAATALNMRPWATMRRVILPQAGVAMLPPLGNVAVDLMKNTALVSLVTVTDLTFRGQMVRATTGETTLIFVLLILCYLVMTYAISLFTGWLERRAPAGMVYSGKGE